MSIYATIPGIGGDGDDETIGAPWVYRGSHILPDEDDPRGGEIGLATPPSHITRDGRDDQPSDGTPWPWLRLSIDTANDDPAVILNPAMARRLARLLDEWADDADPQPAGGPKQPAFDAVFAYLRSQPRDFMPATIVDRNAMIWRAVHAALDAMPAGEQQPAG